MPAKKTAKKKTVKKKIVRDVFVSIVLDESGSMGVVRSATISSFNEYVNSLRKQSEEGCRMMLQTFDFSGNPLIVALKYRFKGVPLKDVPELSLETYSPNGGTPLYDAIMDGIKETEQLVKKKESVFFVIQTDGAENSSKEFKREDVINKIEEKKKDKWVFLFLGADQDAWPAGQAIGISASNTMSYDNTERGISDTQKAMSKSMGVYRTGTGVQAMSAVDNLASSLLDRKQGPIDLRTGTKGSGTTDSGAETKDTD